MSRLTYGRYYIRPVNAPEGYNFSTGPSAFPPPPPVFVPAKVDDLRRVWFVSGFNDIFHISISLSLPRAPTYNWENRDNVLYIPPFYGSATDFRIEAAGNGPWVIGIPTEDLLLTFNGVDAYPQLTFQPARAGSRAQQFEFLATDRD